MKNDAKPVKQRRKRKVTLDEKDAVILNILRNSAREKRAVIALQPNVNLTEAAVGNRIRKMVKEKLIFGYTTRIDWRALGYPFEAFLFIRLKNHAESALRDLHRLLAKDPEFPNVIEFGQVTGEGYDYYVKFRCKDLDEFVDSSDRLKLLVPNIERIASIPFRQRAHYRDDLPINPI